MNIFLDAVDRRRFLALLATVVAKHELACHAYCLMANHFHLVVTTTRANLSDAIQHLNGRYAERWNRRHGRVGHLFQGRFGAQVVQDGRYFLTVCRYVAMNPVRAGLVSAPERWPWSSFRATAGMSPPPPFLCRAVVLAQFGGSDAEAAERFVTFVREGPDDDGAITTARILGDEGFRMAVASDTSASKECPAIDRLAGLPLPALLAGAVSRRDRAAAIARAHRLGHRQVHIARALGVHYTTVSRVIRATEGTDRAESDEERCDPD